VYNLLLSTLLSVLVNIVMAQSAYPLIGARGAGVGYASGCFGDEWSLFNNPAGITDVKHPTVAVAYESVPGSPAFNRAAFAFAMPMSLGGASFGIFRFGDDLYREQVVCIGYANKFGLAALGAKLQYISYYMDGFGRRSVFSFSFGGIAQLTPWLKFGAHVVNISQPEIAEGEKIPTWLIAGVCINTSEKVTAVLEVEKDIDYKPKVKAGIEYRFYARFSARTGININPRAGFFGFGFNPGKYKLDYAYNWNPTILARHQLAISYSFRKRK
jgi:hypothetical protein